MPKMNLLEYYIASTKDVPDGYDLLTGGTLNLTTGFNRLGGKVTNLDYNPNAVVETDAFIIYANETDTTTGYKPTFTGSGKESTGDDGLAVIANVAKLLETYDDAKRMFVEVDTSTEVTSGVYNATAYYVSVSVDTFTGEATKERELSFALASTTDPIRGLYTLATKTFTNVVGGGE